MNIRKLNLCAQNGNDVQQSTCFDCIKNMCSDRKRSVIFEENGMIVLTDESVKNIHNGNYGTNVIHIILFSYIQKE